MKNTLIIGAGQLGSRHLQGLLTSKYNQKVYVVDPSSESLSVAKQRATEVSHNHEVFFSSKLSDIEDNIDLAIIATNSKVRASLIKDLLSIAKVNFLILEKVLFPSLKEYDDVNQLLSKRNVKTWVNHPRRIYSHYQSISEDFSRFSKDTSSYIASGCNWGLGSNALHLIDLFSFIEKSMLDSLVLEGLDNQLIQSKRSGYVEFTGTIRGILRNGSIFSIASSAKKVDCYPGIRVFGCSTGSYFVAEEKGAECLVIRKTNEDEITQVCQIPFQSSLSGLLADQLFDTESCKLTTYEEAMVNHVVFIDSMIEFHNKLTNQNLNYCPIT